MLFTYGKHSREDEPYAWQVGVLFRDTNPFGDEVRVERYQGKEWFHGYEVMRRRVGAKFGIHLHDDLSTTKKPIVWKGRWITYTIPPFTDIDNYAKLLGGKRFELCAHSYHLPPDASLEAGIEYEKAMERLFRPFKESWNTLHESKFDWLTCDCLARNGRPCRSDNAEVELYNIDGKLSVEDGMEFVRELARYLLTKF